MQYALFLYRTMHNWLKIYLKLHSSFYALVISRKNYDTYTYYIDYCNKVREVARRRTVMFDDGGMNDQTSATV